MQKLFWQNDSYENLEKVFDIAFGRFKELSGVIFSVLFILPNVSLHSLHILPNFADCQLKDHLHRF